MLHSVFLLVFLLVAAPLAAFIPLAALAGVLAVVAWLTVRAWPDATSPRKRWTRRIAVWGAAVALVVASHLGAMLVWGADYFTSQS